MYTSIYRVLNLPPNRNFRYSALLVCCLLAWVDAIAIETVRSTHTKATEVRTTANLRGSAFESLDLNQDETERVAYLRTTIRHYLSDASLSPIEILGIHAETDQERDAYARRWAKVVYEDTKRVLAFQRAFDQAMRELTQSEPLIDVTKLPSHQDPKNELQPSDRLLLFVELDCQLCDEAASVALKTTEFINALDIYFVDAEKQCLTRHPGLGSKCKHRSSPSST